MPDFPITSHLQLLLDTISKGGGQPIIVGGSVRDWLLDIPPKDIDVEVYGLPLTALEKLLKSADLKVDAVGASFGVLKVGIRIAGATETFDVSLPRSESKTAPGHKGFVAGFARERNPRRFPHLRRTTSHRHHAGHHDQPPDDYRGSHFESLLPWRWKAVVITPHFRPSFLPSTATPATEC